MAAEEHKYLADVIKNVHSTLREEARNCGPEIAWKRHISRKDVLQKYASSMQKLATTYWEENNLNTKSSTYSRIEWIKNQCEEYFLNGGKQKYDTRENEIKSKIDASFITIVPKDSNASTTREQEQLPKCYERTTEKTDERICLLDVGSCYNPFGDTDMFDVTAIDLNGLPDKVFCCDFLNVHIGERQILSDDKQEIFQLCKNSFHVIVFSLFLEYLPCPKQRYLCCKKAYELLKNSGIFFIISPDSKHVGANARIMKSWRYVLSKLGFMRIKYEKLRHMHCIIFRKCVFIDVAIRWANMQKLPDSDPLYINDTSIYIPQDFRNKSNENTRQDYKYDPEELTSMFSELPFE